MPPPRRRVVAVALAVAAMTAAWRGSERERELGRAGAEARARAQAENGAELAAAEVRRWPSGALEVAETAASLEPLTTLVQSTVNDATFRDFVETETAWAPFRDDGAATAIVLGNRLVASTGAAALVKSAAPLAGEAAARRVAQALVPSPTPHLVAAARLSKQTPTGLAAVVVVSRPLEPRALASLASRLDATLSLQGPDGRPLVAGPAADALAAFRGTGLASASCCARREVAPGLELAAFRDPSPLLAAAEREAQAERRWWLLGGAALALALLWAGFRKPARPVVALVPPPAPAPPVEPADPGLSRTQTSRAPSRYQVISQLGEGGMARVYVAFTTGEQGFHRQFVLKRLREELAANADAVNQFIDEARLGASLVHSNVVPIYDFGRDAEGYFIAQEYILGRDVDAVVARSRARWGKGLEPRVVLYLAQETLRALAYAHSRADESGTSLGLVHRDVSPGNLLVSARGEVKLLDFGLVKSSQRLARTQAGLVKGNLYFMSPEQAKAMPLDARGDLFSLGLVLYFAATGETLYAGETSYELMLRAAGGLTDVDRSQVRALPPPLGSLVERALATAPDERYPSAEAWAQEVAAAGGVATSREVQVLMEQLFLDDLAAEQGRFSPRAG